MRKRRIKIGTCPQCSKILIRKRNIKIRKIKPTICGNCGYKILNPYEVFKPK